MLADGLLTEEELYGTINCDGINAAGEICGVTTTSGLAWKIPGRVGDSPILGAGLYVDNEVGAAGSTGRGEANLFNLASFLIVERMRAGACTRPDAGMEALRRVQAGTVESRLLNSPQDCPRSGCRSTSWTVRAATPACPCTRAKRAVTPCVPRTAPSCCRWSRCSDGSARD